jgi:hypothetical protein
MRNITSVLDYMKRGSKSPRVQLSLVPANNGAMRMVDENKGKLLEH